MFSATDRAGTQLWGGGGVFPSWAVLGVTREEKGRGKDVYGTTRLTSNMLPLPPVFLSMVHGWRWDCSLMVTWARTHSTVGLFMQPKRFNRKFM